MLLAGCSSSPPSSVVSACKDAFASQYGGVGSIKVDKGASNKAGGDWSVTGVVQTIDGFHDFKCVAEKDGAGNWEVTDASTLD